MIIYKPESIDELSKLVDKELHLSLIDTSLVDNMVNLFSNKDKKDYAGIEHWDVSNVADMGFMFWNSNFNHDISLWNLSNTFFMDSMFRQSAFNQDISNWNVSNVCSMKNMFYHSPFNQDISKWNISEDCNTFNMFFGSPLAHRNKLPKWYKE